MSLLLDHDFSKTFDEAAAQLVRQHAIACEELTKEQLVKAFTQALKCGDFQRYVKTDGGQAVVYLPFSQEEQLRHRIEELEQKLSDAELNLALEIGQE